MIHSPKLSAFIIRLQPENASIAATNRALFRSLTGKGANEDVMDSFLFLELFKKFITELDTQSMYSDPKSKKCMTANQPNIEEEHIKQNITPHQEKYVIEGKVEGGSYGKKRKKTSTKDKTINSDVSVDDAITSDFYFFLYAPPFSDKSVLFIQSYTDETIDTVMRVFWQSLFTVPDVFKKPKVVKYIPPSIIDKFKNNCTISMLQFATEVPAKTLFGRMKVQENRFKVEIKISPVGEDFSVDEYNRIIDPIQQNSFARKLRLLDFRKRKGNLRDQTTSKTSQFEISSELEVRPIIQLSKFVRIEDNEGDFDRIRDFCFELLDEVKLQIYPSDGVQVR